MRGRIRLAVLAVALVAVTALPAAADAAFPGANGKIAFESFRDGNWDIYTMDADGSNQTRITNNAVPDRDPAWSPDGKRIAFTSYPDTLTNCPCLSEIYVMNADGTGQTRLTNHQSGYPYLEPTWTPDGKQITFAQRFCDPHLEQCYGGLLTMNADGSGVQFLGSGTGVPAWAPDGTRLAFELEDDFNFGAIYTEKPDATDRRWFCCGSYGNTYPAPHGPDWSPDQQAIVLQTGDGRIARQNFDGTGFAYLTSSCCDAFPDWSPDEAKIAFASNRDGNAEIYVMNTDGTDVTRITANSAFDAYPDWQSLVPFCSGKGSQNRGGCRSRGGHAQAGSTP
jgi:Tol biopolymer transport system component